MKIALVGLTHPFRGGIAHYTTLLCQALQHRHEVRFFALRRQYPTFLFPGTTQKDASQRPVTVP
ncbi:MAG: glycosyl transferase family 1, partial [Candidatus Tectomicrobia bacterium]